MVFYGDKVVITASVVFVHTIPRTKLLVGLYLVSHGSSHQKWKHKVKVWCLGNDVLETRSGRNLDTNYIIMHDFGHFWCIFLQINDTDSPN